ncbi:hypothetical protein DICPUDRAFT_75632 [Dictyostelium purpureum]|uniref:PPPDE domain-containing protein n=1 Tax=Dictyostelium purpureum TaxID=5786 RepID=F0ZB79_DICPU|nr:uncharacterized protein DICPUDRAFT_75632 [Dictyostelium purpureum]EGC38773.1 hypothetical protein DICPUDRAFT_75632 [Dictyostelium purpureum]|eukprot:XP_003284667.1 hypothetical protein DICPUDRAFT_75632 [Dictyostelium purpureum]
MSLKTKVYVCKFIPHDSNFSTSIKSHWGLLVAGQLFHINVDDNNNVIYKSKEFKFYSLEYTYTFIYIGKTKFSLEIIDDTARDIANKFVYNIKTSNCQNFIYELSKLIVPKFKFPLKASDLFDGYINCTTAMGSKSSIFSVNLTEEEIKNERDAYIVKK